jgi:hypothetical protein
MEPALFEPDSSNVRIRALKNISRTIYSLGSYHRTFGATLTLDHAQNSARI